MRRLFWVMTSLLALGLFGCNLDDSIDTRTATTPAEAADREYSASTECQRCHPRQFDEWRTSPHAYSGISPTFYSLVSAGQNSGAAVLPLFDAAGNEIPQDGVSLAGGVGGFCLPCHSPFAFLGSQGVYTGNNAGKAGVEPIYAFVCAPTAPMNNFEPCMTNADPGDPLDAEVVCGGNQFCNTFEGRTCVNTPPVTPGVDFPRQLVRCSADSDCQSTQFPYSVAPGSTRSP